MNIVERICCLSRDGYTSTRQIVGNRGRGLLEGYLQHCKLVLFWPYDNWPCFQPNIVVECPMCCVFPDTLK